MSEYCNTVPVLPGFWSDPTICRAGDDFYLANSSFEYFPGAPIHHSTDLLDWNLTAHVITRPEQSELSAGAGSKGIYGSTIRHHAGRFWFITTNVYEVMQGQQLFTADDPNGPWSDPVYVPVVGIDPDIAWDDDGTCYVTWAGSGERITQVTINPSTGALLSEPRHLWSGTGMRNPEGPHLYHIGDWWYLLIAEGGTDRGHSVSIARSRFPYGPYEPDPANPILTHRSSSHPVQSVGHADLVEGPGGQWYAVYHGTRPHGRFPEFHVIGRETMLARVEWSNEWPAIVESDLVVPRDHSFTDDFTTKLSPRWVSSSNRVSGVRPSPRGLELTASAAPWPLLTRVTDLEWTATVTLDVSRGDARVALRLDDDHWYGIEVTSEAMAATATIGPLRGDLGRSQLEPGRLATVRISVRLPEPTVGFPTPAPDVVTLSVVDGDTVHDLAVLDGRYLSTEVACGFTGRMVGVAAIRGIAVVTSFEYSSRDWTARA